ncbi:APC family permease [Streptomyces sp. NPDC054887]
MASYEEVFLLTASASGQPMSDMPDPDSGLRGNLSTTRLVVLVSATAAPLLAMAGTLPISLAIGNGAGVPGAYLLVTLTLLCFAVGYAAISRRITSGGGFFTYVNRSLGRPPGAAAGVLALIAYNTLAVGLAGGVGYFSNIVVLDLFDVSAPWWIFSFVLIAVMAVLGYRQIDLSAQILVILMLFEVLMLVILDLAIVIEKGTAAFPAVSFEPSTVFSGAPGVALMFAFGSFVGFEGAAIYAHEAKNPGRGIPRATYIAVSAIGVFYCLTSWLVVGALGVDNARTVAGEQAGALFLGLTDQFLGQAMVYVFELLVITSAFACLTASHTVASRYLYTLGHAGLLPAALSRVHARHRSPHVASIAQSGLILAVVIAYAVADLHPYRNLTATMLGLSALAVVLLQALVSIAVFAYFRGREGGHWWRTAVAPLIGFAGLLIGTTLIMWNFDTLTGSSSVMANSLPWLVIALALLAPWRAVWLRSHRPRAYALLDDQHEVPRP